MINKSTKVAFPQLFNSPTLSLLNHSCIPNVAVIDVDDKLVLIVTEPIPAYQQLFYCYGPSFLTSNRKDRQDLLKSQYNFTCVCSACTRQNYPGAAGLNALDQELSLYVMNQYTLLFNTPSWNHITPTQSREKAVEFYQKIEENFNKIKATLPRQEIVQLQSIALICLLNISNTISMKFP